MQINIQYATIKSNVGSVIGLTLPGGKKIYIQRGLGKHRTFEVMMHELTHATLINLKIKRSKVTHEKIALKVGRYALRTVFKRSKHG